MLKTWRQTARLRPKLRSTRANKTLAPSAPSALSRSKIDSHATTLGTGMTALSNGISMTVSAMMAGGSGMLKLSQNIGSTAKHGMANARAATLHGTGIGA